MITQADIFEEFELKLFAPDRRAAFNLLLNWMDYFGITDVGIVMQKDDKLTLLSAIPLDNSAVIN